LLAWLTSLGVALAVGGPIALVALVVGVLLIVGGVRLQRSGMAAEKTTLDRALLALAHERQRVSAAEAAAALGLNLIQADALLTALAKREPERIGVDVDDHGVLWYRALGAQARVAAGVGPFRRVRVDSPPWGEGAQRPEDVADGADAGEVDWSDPERSARGRR
jgi:hypothetical protein